MTTGKVQRKGPHREALVTSISRIAEQLLEILGARLTAFMVGLSDPKALTEYAKGERSPQSETDTKLRTVHQIVVTLMKGDIPSSAIQAWFTGMNPDLEDESPAKVILENPKRVLEAARAFVEVAEG